MAICPLGLDTGDASKRRAHVLRQLRGSRHEQALAACALNVAAHLCRVAHFMCGWVIVLCHRWAGDAGGCPVAMALPVSVSYGSDLSGQVCCLQEILQYMGTASPAQSTAITVCRMCCCNHGAVCVLHFSWNMLLLVVSRHAGTPHGHHVHPSDRHSQDVVNAFQRCQ